MGLLSKFDLMTTWSEQCWNSPFSSACYFPPRLPDNLHKLLPSWIIIAFHLNAFVVNWLEVTTLQQRQRFCTHSKAALRQSFSACSMQLRFQSNYLDLSQPTQLHAVNSRWKRLLKLSSSSIKRLFLMSIHITKVLAQNYLKTHKYSRQKVNICQLLLFVLLTENNLVNSFSFYLQKFYFLSTRHKLRHYVSPLAYFVVRVFKLHCLK